MTRVFLVMCVVGCASPSQPGRYPQPGSTQPGPGPQPQSQPRPEAQPGAASCHATLDCYNQCNPMTDACVASCDQRTTPASAQGAHAVLQCSAENSCQFQGCVTQRCGAQITACTNLP